jgi:hypothetical protein
MTVRAMTISYAVLITGGLIYFCVLALTAR